MKLSTFVILTITLVLSINCSAKIETANTVTETTVQTNTNSQSTNSDDAEGSAVQTNLGKVSPDAVVKELYDQHKKNKGPFYETKNRALLDKFFDKTLADFIWGELNSTNEEVGVLDFDALYNAQDTDIKKFIVSEPKITGDKAEVVASFENFGNKENITFSMVKSGDSWKIADIKYGNKDTLLGYFREDAKNKTSNNTSDGGEFEGKYQVGDTTCTVKPIKMAFEIKWAKGSGTMVFFFDSEAAGGLTYASEDGGKGRDKFVFDDESLSTGKFIRADGKEMTVKRAK